MSELSRRSDSDDDEARDAQYVMRFGPRTYTEAQREAMREAVANREPLPEPPLPVEDE